MYGCVSCCLWMAQHPVQFSQYMGAVSYFQHKITHGKTADDFQWFSSNSTNPDPHTSFARCKVPVLIFSLAIYIFMTSPLINSHGASSSRKQNWLCNHDANPRLKERKLGEGSRALQHSPHGKVTLERAQEGSLYTNLTPTDANLFQGSNDLSVNESVSQKIHQPTKWQNNNPVPRMCHR